MTSLVELGKIWNIDVVKSYPGNISNIDSFISETSQLNNQEGFVVRFYNGQMFKIKALEYVRLHKMLDLINNEVELIKLIFDEKIDDILPLVMEDIKNNVLNFEKDLMHSLSITAKKNVDIAISAKDNIDKLGISDPKHRKKIFAVDYASKYPEYSSILFKIWDSNDFSFENSWNLLKSKIYANCSTNSSLEKVRNLFGLKWSDYYKNLMEDDS